MTIGAELEAQILRYYHVEKWRAGTIARQLHVHHGTVHRVLAQAGLPRIGGLQRPSQIDTYLPFIHETLKKFPSLTASRLYAMVERGESEGKSACGLVASGRAPTPRDRGVGHVRREKYSTMRAQPRMADASGGGVFGPAAAKVDEHLDRPGKR